MWNRYVFVLGLAMLAGCTTVNVSEVYLSDGTRGHHVSCSGLATSSAGCYQKAGDVCGAKGYTIVNLPFAATSSGDLFIKCKG